MIVVNIIYEDDVVATQCGFPGFDWICEIYGRARWLGLNEHLNFVDAHLVSNYLWVVNRVGRGQIKSRYYETPGILINIKLFFILFFL